MCQLETTTPQQVKIILSLFYLDKNFCNVGVLFRNFFFISSVWKRTSREKEKKEKGETQEASKMNFEDVFQWKKNYGVVASVLT